MEKKRCKFPPMLGPASNQPEGSYQWAECWGNELEYRAESVERMVWDLANFVAKLVVANPPPWSVFPDPPCGNIDTYLRLCCGLNHQQITALLMMFGHAVTLGEQDDEERDSD
jgi:hypothetical protein